ncbi:unnamed protein product [Symbiodinium sp. CCMP2456]|nr:unnamed protein product [Symbiodinium sp. CCMP2456]
MLPISRCAREGLRWKQRWSRIHDKSSWQTLRAAGAGCATAAAAVCTSAKAQSSLGTIIKWPKREIRGLLQQLKSSEPILEKYLEYAGDPWMTDYAELRPLMEVQFDEISHESVDRLEAWRESGQLAQVKYTVQQLKRGRFFALVTCDVHQCGFVAGAGLAVGSEDAKQLAAQQALDRLFFPEEPVEEIKRCAKAMRNNEAHSGARLPAIQAAETLVSLEGKLEDVFISAFQPCGKAWQAAIACKCFETHVVGPAADYDRDVAVALAAETFMSRLRWYIRVPAGDPHEPELWSQTWAQRQASMGQPWSGRTSVLRHEVLRLSPLGGHMGGEDEVRRVLPTEANWKLWQTNLKSIQDRRCTRWAAEQLYEGAETPSADAATFRHFRRIPEADDPRRVDVRGKLPIEQIRESLGEVLNSSQVLVVSGGTGSGKTTQLPQFLLDDWDAEHAPRIVVTQPRRIAAISVAERVAWERGQPVGQSIGYAVHGNAIRPSARGSIEFLTVGTLLRRAVDDSCLRNCDVVIVDEVHERDMLTDFLLVLLREVLPSRPDLKLVLMSATLDVQSFTSYFDSCPVLEVQSETLFPVEEVHLEEDFFSEFTYTNALLTAEDRAREAAEQTETQEGDDADRESPAQRLWGGYDGGEIDKLLHVMESSICAVVREMSSRNSQEVKGSVLCFLPGWSEIRQLQERLSEGEEAKQIWSVPLHSTLPKERQQQVFQKPPKSKVKVILATNIAESSVTINDVEVVIDSGLQRELAYDAKRRMSSLDTVWVSQSGAVQRRGRAGRVRSGRVLRLYSRQQFSALPPQPSPEMQRCDLAQSCLQAIALGRDPRKFLASALDQPNVAAVDSAMEQLVAIRAISNSDPEDCPTMLAIGEVLARLPLEPLLGRAAMLGCVLGIPQPAAALLVAAGGRAPFVGSRQEVVEAQKEFCSWSDPVAAARALLAWEERAAKDAPAAQKWAEQKRLSPSRLAGLARDKAYLLRDMQRAGLLRLTPVTGTKTDADVSAAEDSAALLETRGELEEALEKVEQEEHDQGQDMSSSSSANSISDIQLVTVLCSAYPANIAMRSKDKTSSFQISNLGTAVMSPASVNAEGEDGLWWLYGDVQVGANRSFMHSTTQVADWQLALFGGLRYKESDDQKKHTCMVLDNWLQVGARVKRTNELLLRLRQLVNDAIAWKAIDALDGAENQTDGMEISEVSEKLVQCVRSVVGVLGQGSTQEEVDDDQAGPPVEDFEEAEEAAPSKEELSNMTISQLKDLLKSKGLKARPVFAFRCPLDSGSCATSLAGERPQGRCSTWLGQVQARWQMRTSPSGPDTQRSWDILERSEPIACEVPGEHRMDILTAGDGLMIQADDCDSWKEPTPEEREHVSHFLKQEKMTGEKRKPRPQ